MGKKFEFGQSFRKISLLVKFSKNFDFGQICEKNFVFGQIFEKFRFWWNFLKFGEIFVSSKISKNFD